MDSRDRMAIEALFAKLAGVERSGQPRDAEAEAFIAERIAAQPGAPYYLAQTVIVQEQALDSAQQRIAELEAMLAERPAAAGSAFDGLFGGNGRPASPGHVPSIPAANTQARSSTDGGGFLTGAAQTAMGVAGGVLIASMISGLFGRDAAQAAQPGLDNAATDWDFDGPAIEPADYEDDGFDFFDGDFDI